MIVRLRGDICVPFENVFFITKFFFLICSKMKYTVHRLVSCSNIKTLLIVIYFMVIHVDI